MRTVHPILALAATLLLATAGCKRSNTAAVPPTPLPAATKEPTFVVDPALESLPVAMPAELNEEIRKRGAITFRSWNGTWIGTDCDTDLTFLPGGAVHLFQYADMVLGYDGTYAITNGGEVTAQFPTLGQPWPVLTLRRDGKSLLLIPKRDVQQIDLANQVGATISAGQGSYWPFRPISGKDARFVRERISQNRSDNDRR
jgi:hypothetical protein